MELKVKVNKNILAKKLQALYDYVVFIQIIMYHDFILIGDSHGTDKIPIRDNEIKGSLITKSVLEAKIDRREFSKKLKAMTENNIYLTLSSEHSLIKLDGILTDEQSTYYCYNNPTDKPKEELKEQTTAFKFFKNLLKIE